jgi:GTPase SAR1 family protein
LDKAKSWVKELQRQANPNIVIALVGNRKKMKMLKKVQALSDKFLKKRLQHMLKNLASCSLRPVPEQATVLTKCSQILVSLTNDTFRHIYIHKN